MIPIYFLILSTVNSFQEVVLEDLIEVFLKTWFAYKLVWFRIYSHHFSVKNNENTLYGDELVSRLGSIFFISDFEQTWFSIVFGSKKFFSVKLSTSEISLQSNLGLVLVFWMCFLSVLVLFHHCYRIFAWHWHHHLILKYPSRNIVLNLDRGQLGQIIDKYYSFSNIFLFRLHLQIRKYIFIN